MEETNDGFKIAEEDLILEVQESLSEFDNQGSRISGSQTLSEMHGFLTKLGRRLLS